MQTSKPSKVQLPPKKETLSKEESISESKIQKIINKGGSSISYNNEKGTAEVVRNFSVKLSDQDLKMVTLLCKQRPQRFGRKISFAKQDWFLEAVKEKIERDRKKYNI